MLLASSVSGLFKWRQFEPEVILLAVGWYLRFSILVYRKRSGRFLIIAGGGKEPIEIGLRAQPYRDGDEFGDIVGVELAQAQFDRGKKVCARLDEHQGFGCGFHRSLPSIDRMDIGNDIDAGCELLGDESGRDATGFLW